MLKLRGGFFLVSSRAWDKEKILSSHEDSNLRPSDSGILWEKKNLSLPLSYIKAGESS